MNPRGIGGSYSESNYQLDLILEKTFPHTPELAVTNVMLPKTVVGQGLLCKINTTVSNKGLYYETFYVALYANTTTLKTLTITLTSKDSTTITFTWNTTDFAYGNCTITTIAIPVPGETDTADNVFEDGTIFVTITGDVNCDLLVETYDLLELKKVYGCTSKGPNWNPNCDFNDDGKVEASDLFDLGKNYGKTI